MVNAGFDSEAEGVLHEMRQNLKAEHNVRSVAVQEVLRQALSQLEGDLVVTARAFNRLPPVVTTRSGWQARLEIWLKRYAKSLTNWYTWEQVNFNSATNDALHSIELMFLNYEKERAELRAQIKKP